MTQRFLRPAVAAETYGVSQSTLRRWAARGLIGSTRVDGIVWFAAQDIADVLAAGAVPRTASLIATGRRIPSLDDPRVAEFWRGTSAEAVR